MKKLSLLLSVLFVFVFLGAGCSFGTDTDTGELDQILEDALDEAQEDEYEDSTLSEDMVYGFMCDEDIVDCEDVEVELFMDEPWSVYYEDGTEEMLYNVECDDTGFCYVEDLYGTVYYLQI